MKTESDRAGSILVQWGAWCLWLSDDREYAFWTCSGRFVTDATVGAA